MFSLLIGKDWKPGTVATTPVAVLPTLVSPTPASPDSSNFSIDENSLLLNISTQGDAVRKLKTGKLLWTDKNYHNKKFTSLKSY